MGIIARAEPHRVGCVGDSNTCGTGLTGRDTYPEQLSRLLARHQMAGSTFHVENFGKSGATAGATQGKFKSYAGTAVCKKTLAFAAHTYVVMLGTNDAANCQPGDAELGLKSLVLGFLNQGAKVILVLPPGAKGGRMRPNFAFIVHPAVRQVAAVCGLEAIEPDLSYREAYLRDHVHLSVHGAASVAQAIATCLLVVEVVVVSR